MSDGQAFTVEANTDGELHLGHGEVLEVSRSSTREHADRREVEQIATYHGPGVDDQNGGERRPRFASVEARRGEGWTIEERRWS